MANNTNEFYEPTELSMWDKIFIKCSGTILGGNFQKTTIDDQGKRRNTGILVFIIISTSACLASVSWSIPLGWKGIFVGPFWFMIMLFLERILLQQMDTNNYHNTANQWLAGNFDPSTMKSRPAIWIVIMRFVLIFFISYVNSEMVQVLMFKPEIVAETMLRQNKETAHIVDSLSAIRKVVDAKYNEKEKALSAAQANQNNLISNYDQRIAALDDSLTFWNSKYVYEVKGPNGVTGISGDGPVAKSIQKTIDRFTNMKIDLVAERDGAKSESSQMMSITMAQNELEQAKAVRKVEVDKIDKKQAELIKQIIDRPVNGLYYMLSVLSDISGRNPFIWFMFFLFFLIEAIPIIVKAMMKNDSYIYWCAVEYIEMRSATNELAKRALAAFRLQ